MGTSCVPVHLQNHTSSNGPDYYLNNIRQQFPSAWKALFMYCNTPREYCICTLKSKPPKQHLSKKLCVWHFWMFWHFTINSSVWTQDHRGFSAGGKWGLPTYKMISSWMWDISLTWTCHIEQQQLWIGTIVKQVVTCSWRVNVTFPAVMCQVVGEENRVW